MTAQPALTHAPPMARPALWISLGLTVLLHLVMLPVMVYEFERYAARPVTVAPVKSERTPQVPVPLKPKPKPKPPKQPERPRLQYLQVEQPEEDEPVDPARAVAQARMSRRARDEAERNDLPAGGPYVERGVNRLLTDQRSPRPGQARENKASRIQDLREPARKPRKAQRPQPKARPTPEQQQQTRKRQDPGTLTHAPESELPESPEARPTPPQPQQRPRPKIIDLREQTQQGGQRSTPRMNRKTSAKLAGTRSMEVLKSRYPDYLEKFVKQMRRSFDAETSAAQLTYKQGDIVIQFGIARDGKVYGIQVISAPDDLIQEKALCLNAIRNASPFPPLEPEMVNDPLFKKVLVLFIF